MKNNKRKNIQDRRHEERRKYVRRENNRGIVDRRGAMERRELNRRMEDKENLIEQDYERIFDDKVEGRNAV